MKVSDIVKQTKEYERLDYLIREIKSAIEKFARVNTIEKNLTYAAGTMVINGGYIGAEATTKREDVFLSCGVSELVRDDVKAVLKKHLEALKTQRDGLSV